MKTIDQYIAEVEAHLPRWYPGRPRILEDLRIHLLDRVAAGEREQDVVRQMEPAVVYATELTDGIELSPATVTRRIGAFAIDLLLLGLPGAAAFYVIAVALLIPESFAFNFTDIFPMLWNSDSSSRLMIIWIIAALPLASLPVLSLVYFPAAEAVYGTTIGKHLMRIGVVGQDGTRVDWAKAYVRRIPFFFQFYFIDALFVLFSGTRQRAFDRVARTLVVTYPVGGIGREI